uniref:Uncharacterized protein n=1 Tax=Vespula pensylvanica TaxID=30213 RepID=A0A834K9M9_VESPE|nr:hypothetical protein H0235_015608 [Vespula pensylvanica]
MFYSGEFPLFSKIEVDREESKRPLARLELKILVRATFVQLHRLPRSVHGLGSNGDRLRPGYLPTYVRRTLYRPHTNAYTIAMCLQERRGKDSHSGSPPVLIKEDNMIGRIQTQCFQFSPVPPLCISCYPAINPDLWERIFGEPITASNIDLLERISGKPIVCIPIQVAHNDWRDEWCYIFAKLPCNVIYREVAHVIVTNILFVYAVVRKQKLLVPRKFFRTNQELYLGQLKCQGSTRNYCKLCICICPTLKINTIGSSKFLPNKSGIVYVSRCVSVGGALISANQSSSFCSLEIQAIGSVEIPSGKSGFVAGIGSSKILRNKSGIVYRSRDILVGGSRNSANHSPSTWSLLGIQAIQMAYTN